MTFKCAYCDSTNHAEVDCGKKKNDRRVEVSMGCIFGVLLSPFAFLGLLGGAAWGAAKAGFKFTENFWNELWQSFQDKKKNGGPEGGETG